MVLDDLETPSVIVDLDVMQRNIEAMQKYCDEHGFDFRPHIKTHKIPEIAHLQLQAGAVGITCQKIGEAEVMAAAGIRDILIYYNIIGPAKLERLSRLAKRVHLSVAVDSSQVLQGLGEMTDRENCRIGIFIDCDTGLHRTGVRTPQEAIQLVKEIQTYPNLEFRGLSTFPLKDASGSWFEQALGAFRAQGLEVPYISAGSSAGPKIAHQLQGIRGLVAGTYVFYDRSSVEIGLTDLDHCAARVLATVVSRPSDTLATIDAGSKTLSSDFGYMKDGNGYGYVVEYPEARIFSLSEEHGQIDFSGCSRVPEVGERISVIPNHVCAMMNLHDTVYGVRRDRVEAVWDVAARGKVK